MTVPLPESYRKAYQDFTGGLCTRINPLVVPAEKMTQLDNAVINDSDILEKVSGTILDGSPFPNSIDSFIRMLINYRVGTTINSLVVAAQDSGNSNATYKVDIKQSFGDGTYSYIGHTTGTALFTNASATVTGSTTLWTLHLKAGDKIKPNLYSNWYEIQSVNSNTSITLTSNYTDTTTVSTPYMARIILNYTALPIGLVFNDKLLVANGVDSVLSFDNTSIGKLQSANWQTVLLLEKHKNRVFGARWPGNTSGLLWSYANDETTVDSAAKATIFAKDNGNIVAIKSFSNSLLVFKDTGSVYQVSGEFDQDQVGQPASIRQVDIPDNIGMIAGRSVVIQEDTSTTQGFQRVGSHVYFLAETGIYAINTGMQVVKVSWDIAPTLLGISFKSTSIANKNYPFTAKSQWDSGTNSGLSTNRTTNGLTALFDTQTLAGAKHSNNCTATAIDTTNNVHTTWVGVDGVSIWYNKWLELDNTSVTSKIFDRTASPVMVDSAGVTFSATKLASGPDSVSIATAPNGNIGIVSKYQQSSQATTSGGTTVGLVYVLSELVSGSWIHTAFQISSRDRTNSPQPVNDYDVNAVGLSIQYTASSNINILCGQCITGTANSSLPSYGFTWNTRVAGVWSVVYNQDQSNNINGYDSSFIVDSTGVIHVAFATSGTLIKYFKSTNSGVSFTVQTDITLTGTTPAIGYGKVSVSANDATTPQAIIVYNYTTGIGGNVGKVIRYNASLTTSSTYDSSTGTLKGYVNSGLTNDLIYTANSGVEKFIYNITYKVGTATFVNGSTAIVGTGTKWTTWVKTGDVIRVATDSESTYGTVLTVNSDTSITLSANYTGTSTSAAYVAKRTLTVSSGFTTVSDTVRVGDSGLSQQGNLVATVSFGTSADAIVVRRVTLSGQWVSPVESDSTLSQWFTYDVGSPTSNGNTITYEVALSTSNTFTTANTSTITPGSVISTSTTFTYVKSTISYTLVVFAQSSIQSLVMRYAGGGADAKLPTAFVFNNEIYLAVSEAGQAGNNSIIFYDRKQAYGRHTFAVTAMARYNQQLYAGSSTNGNIYKLRQGYNDNGSAYTLTATTKEDLLGSLELQKTISKVYVIFKTQLTGSFTFSYALDVFKSPNTPTWTDQVIDQTTNGVVEVPVQQTCTSIQMRVTQADANVKVGIIGFIVLYGYLNLR